MRLMYHNNRSTFYKESRWMQLIIIVLIIPFTHGAWNAVVHNRPTTTCNTNKFQHRLTTKYKENNDLMNFFSLSKNRRKFISNIISSGCAGACIGCWSNPDRSNADDEISRATVAPKQFLSGAVLMPDSPSSTITQSDTSNAALYITCRPDRPDNVPAAILNGTRGKAPPVLSARFANPTFPFQFSLSEENLTVEGSQFEWFSRSDLIVSARYDQDGVAATRSPDDLVGRRLISKEELSKNAHVSFQLEGRGVFGKFATGKSSK